jgi:hypothetical protein
MGIKVSAIDNTQLIMYALGAIELFKTKYNLKVSKAINHIAQPRLDHYETEELTLETLDEWRHYLSQKAALALKEDAPRVPYEDACRFCKAKTSCPALGELTTKVFIPIKYEETVKELDEDKVQFILDNSKLIKDFLSSLENKVTQKLMLSEAQKGYKLVRNKGKRYFTEDAGVKLKQLLGDEAYEKKLIGITKAEKLLGKKVIDEISDYKKGSLTLAKETDKRLAVMISCENEFEKLDG